MEGTPHHSATVGRQQLPICRDEGQAPPFAAQWITITKQKHIELTARAGYWEAQHARANIQIEALKQDVLVKDAKIKDLQNRLLDEAAIAADELSPNTLPAARSPGGRDDRDTPAREYPLEFYRASPV